MFGTRKLRYSEKRGGYNLPKKTHWRMWVLLAALATAIVLLSGRWRHTA